MLRPDRGAVASSSGMVKSNRTVRSIESTLSKEIDSMRRCNHSGHRSVAVATAIAPQTAQVHTVRPFRLFGSIIVGCPAMRPHVPNTFAGIAPPRCRRLVDRHDKPEINDLVATIGVSQA